MRFFKNLDFEKQIYLLGWVAILLVGLPLVIYVSVKGENCFGRCIIYSHYHVYCPGCGGTRAVLALLKGQILKSFLYHPIVLYTAVVALIYMGSHTLELLHVPHVRGIEFRLLYLVIAFIIIVVNVIVKNIMLNGFGITMETVIGCKMLPVIGAWR